MELFDEINQHKKLCAEYFRKRHLRVLMDVKISERIRWRPHVFATDGSKIIVDILDSNSIPKLNMKKYESAMNSIDGLQISIAVLANHNYLPELVSQCYKNGIGIIAVRKDSPKQILPPKPLQIDKLSSKDQLAIIPKATYGNLLQLRKLMRFCRVYLNWLELNLPRRVMETIYDDIKDDNLKVQTIRLLRAVDDKIDGGFREEFRKFRKELSVLGVGAELRIIMDKRVAETVHARYIYSLDSRNREIKAQLPPVNSMSGGQWDNIFTNVKTVPSFDEYWKQGTDIIANWGAVEQAVADHLKNKELERQLREQRQSRTT